MLLSLNASQMRSVVRREKSPYKGKQKKGARTSRRDRNGDAVYPAQMHGQQELLSKRARSHFKLQK